MVRLFTRWHLMLFVMGLWLPPGLGIAAPPDIDRIAPKELPSGNSGQVLQEAVDETEADPQRDVVLVEMLRGLVFLQDPARLEAGGRADVTGIVIDGELELADSLEFSQRFEEFLHQPLSLSVIDRITQATVRFYRDHDRPVVDVLVPDGQDITDGVLQVLVILGKRGQVRVEGAQYGSPEALAAAIRFPPDAILTRRALEEDLAWLNHNPFRRVNVLFERGETFGTTDLVLQVQERFPLRIYGGVEDSGPRATGRYRWLSGFNVGNLFGWDHQLNYQFTTTFDPQNLKAHSVTYRAPLPWRQTLTIFGAAVRAKPPRDAAGFRLEGKNYQLGLHYTIPLTQLPRLQHELVVGYAFKRSNNTLEFGGERVFQAFTHISQFSGSYNGQLEDDWGVTQWSFSGFLSPGNMMDKNRDDDFATSRAMASADYLYGRMRLSRVTSLPKTFSWVVEFQGQVSNANLLGSEQFGLGGYQTVRGYDSYASVGDNGVLLRNELRVPNMKGLAWFSPEAPQDDVQLLWFMDYGVVEPVDPLPGERHATLWSTGPGLRYALSPWFTARLDYGWQLQTLPTKSHRDSRLHFGFVLSY